tara:strand:+ start:12216 stop:12713 length:498 start_codon:yes stop_codon:yes gene_type:complete
MASVYSNAILALQTLYSMQTNTQHKTSTDTLAQRVNDVVLQTPEPFNCSNTSVLWYTANDARHELVYGLKNCTETMYYKCRAKIYNTDVTFAFVNHTLAADHLLQQCFNNAVPNAYNPQKIAQAGTYLRRAYKARLTYLLDDVFTAVGHFNDNFEKSRGSGSRQT